MIGPCPLGRGPTRIVSANKAPGGYGLGVLWNKAPDMDADQISATGFFMARKNIPSNNYWGIVSFNYDNESAVQWGISQDSVPFYGSVTKREKRNSTWGPWEWEIAPMDLNTEYRTTERYMRKPVYVKMVNLGEGTNGKTVNVGTMEMIHVECRATYSGWSLPMPELPFGSTDRSLEHTNAQAFYSNANTVTIIKGSTCPAFTATAKVYYIKSTD